MLYRVWRDFGSGGTDRRGLRLAGEDPAGAALGADPQVRLLASSSGFTGEPGKFAALAIESGFLALDQAADGSRQLVCAGFYPINAPSGGAGSRSRGAFERSRRNQRQKAEDSSESHLKLWNRTGVASALTDGQQKQAMVFLYSIARALHPMAMPADETLQRPGGLLEKAWALIQAHPEAEIDSTLRWLIAMRKDPRVKRDFGVLLGTWPELAASAKRDDA
jgi:hypothetical protein